MAEPRLASGPRTTGRSIGIEPGRLDDIVAPPRPLLRPAARSAMFFPLVVVAAVLPGLYALNWWDLTPPGPWWGVRGLAVLEGRLLDQVPLSGLGPAIEARAYRQVALQPPLFAWLEALSLSLSSRHDPLATVLPSYAAGVLVILLVYLHGRLWRGPGLGLVAAILTAFSRELLVPMQLATPATLGEACLLGTLLCYGRYQFSGDARRRTWVLPGGATLGLAMLAVGPVAFLAVPVVVLHQAILLSEPATRRPSRWWRGLLSGPGGPAGLATLGLALALAIPWYAWMFPRYGTEFLGALLNPPRSGSEGLGLVGTLLRMAPAILPLSALGLARSIRRSLAAEENDAATVGGTFWVAWLFVAALAPAFWPGGPRSSFTLFLLVPVNLLAAQAMVDLANRVIPGRTLIWLAPATALSVFWWLSNDLRVAVASLLAGRRPDLALLFELHVGADILIVLAGATRWLDRWARRHDRRRRLVLGGFLIGVLLVTAASGLREVPFRHRETSDLLELRQAILRRERSQPSRPFNVAAVVGPDLAALEGTGFVPPGRLRFLLRATLPHLTPLDLTRVEELQDLPNPPNAQRLVILIGSDAPLPYRMQSQLGLEALYYGQSRALFLHAFASTEGPRERKRRR